MKKKKSFLNSFSCLKEMLKRSRGIFTFTQKCAKQKLPNETAKICRHTEKQIFSFSSCLHLGVLLYHRCSVNLYDDIINKTKKFLIIFLIKRFHWSQLNSIRRLRHVKIELEDINNLFVKAGKWKNCKQKLH